MSSTMTLKMVKGVSYSCVGVRPEPFSLGDEVTVPSKVGAVLLDAVYVDKSNNEHHYWERVTSKTAVVEEYDEQPVSGDDTDSIVGDDDVEELESLAEGGKEASTSKARRSSRNR